MSDVPEGYESAYTEQDGKAVLTGGEFEFKNEADVLAMGEAKKNANIELSEAKAKLKAFDGIDPSKVSEMTNEIELLRTKIDNGGSDEETIKTLVDSQVSRLMEAKNAESDDWKSKFEKEQGFRFNNELESNLSKEFDGKVDASFMKDTVSMAKGGFVREANGEWMKDGKTIAETALKFVEDRPHFAPKNTGGGATGSTNVVELSGRAKFNDLLKKQQGGEVLNRQESIELSTLANNLKNEEN